MKREAYPTPQWAMDLLKLPKEKRMQSIIENDPFTQKRLKKLRKPGHFIHDNDATYCVDCSPRHLLLTEKRWEDDDVQVWEVRSHGWTSPPVCSACGLSIEVFVDGMSIRLPAVMVEFLVRGTETLRMNEEEYEPDVLDAVAKKLENGVVEEDQVELSLTLAEVYMLAEVIDAVRYWDVSDPSYRDSGNIIDPGSDDEDDVALLRELATLEDKVRLLATTYEGP